jgi:hypothetical protein
MSDIVERLLEAAVWPYNINSPNELLMKDAAAEIERLRAALRMRHSATPDNPEAWAEACMATEAALAQEKPNDR